MNKHFITVYIRRKLFTKFVKNAKKEGLVGRSTGHLWKIQSFTKRGGGMQALKRGARDLTGENLKVVWAEFSTLS